MVHGSWILSHLSLMKPCQFGSLSNNLKSILLWQLIQNLSLWIPMEQETYIFTFPNVSSWSLPYSSKPAIKMSPAMPNTFGILLNKSSILFWTLSPAGGALNDSLMYLYMPNGQENIVKNDDLSSSFRFWYPEHASIYMTYSMPAKLSSISSNVGPLCTGLFMPSHDQAQSYFTIHFKNQYKAVAPFWCLIYM